MYVYIYIYIYITYIYIYIYICIYTATERSSTRAVWPPYIWSLFGLRKFLALMYSLPRVPNATVVAASSA